MPVSSSKELGVSLLSQNSSDSISSIPIKKRPIAVPRSSSPPSQASSPPHEDCHMLWKKIKVLETKSFDSASGAQAALGTTFAMEYPFWLSKESNVNRDLNLVQTHESLVGLDQQESRFGIATTAGKGSGDVKEEDMPAIGLIKGNSKLLSALEGSLSQPLDRSSDGKSVLSGSSAFQGGTAMTEVQPELQWSYGQSRDGQDGTKIGLHLPSKDLLGLAQNCQNSHQSIMKQGKLDYCSEELAHADEQHDFQGQCSTDPTDYCAKRLNWDLNTVVDLREGSNCVLTMNSERCAGKDVGVVHQKKHESLQVHPMRFGGCDLTLGRCNLTRNDYDFRLASSSMLINNHDVSDVGLELQLRPPCRPDLHSNCGTPSAYDKLGNAVPDLSLSLTRSIHMAGCRAIKSEPYEGGQKDSSEGESGVPKFCMIKHVKSEPHEGMFQEESLNTTGFGHPKSASFQSINPACCRPVKAEPLEEPSQGYFTGSEVNSFFTDVNGLTSMPCRTEAPQEASESMVTADGWKQDDAPEMSISTSFVLSAIVDKSLNLKSESTIQDMNNLPHCEEMPSEACIIRGENIVAAEASDLVSESPTSEQKESGSANEKVKNASVTSNYHLKSLICDGQEYIASNQVPKVSTLIDSVDGNKFNSSEYIVADELHTESYGNNMKAESDEEKKDTSAEIQQESCDNERGLDKFDTIGAGGVTPKDGGGDDYKDHEVRDSLVNGTIEASREQNDEKQACDGETVESPVSVDAPVGSVVSAGAPIIVPSIFDANENQVQNSVEKQACDGETVDPVVSVDAPVDSVVSVGAPIIVPSILDGNENQVQNSVEKQAYDGETVDPVVCVDASIMVPSILDGKENQVQNSVELKNDPGTTDNKLTGAEEAPTIELLNSGKKRLTKTSHEPGKESACEKKLKYSRETEKSPRKGSQGKQCRQVDSAAGFDLPAKHTILSNSGSDGTSHNRIIKLITAPKKVSCEKKCNLTGLTLPRAEKEKLVDKSIRQSKPHHIGSRDESCRERSQKFDGERSREPIGKGGSDAIRFRKRTNAQLDALHHDKDSESDYIIGRRRGPPRSPRLGCIPLVALDGSVGRVGSMMRVPISDEPPNLAHLPFRRPSPGSRGQLPVGARIAGRHVVNPRWCNGRDVPDFLLGNEEKIMRTLEDDMIDPRLLQHLRSRLERPENTLVQRERSRSPIPLHLPHTSLESSAQSRLRSPHRLFPPRRLPDGFSGRRELIRCRSPPGIRLERVGSPRHPRFAEDMVVRRHGSPLHVSQLTNDVRDPGPLREHDFPGPDGRVLQRNIQRFDLMDPRQVEECFGRPQYRRFPDIVRGDECVDDRRNEERCGLVHPLRQRLCFSENDEDRLGYPIEDGHPRAFRNRPDVNENFFPDRGSARDLTGPISKRLGSIHGRLSGMGDQEGDHMYRGRQGWRDADMNDTRLKRRRF